MLGLAEWQRRTICIICHPEDQRWTPIIQYTAPVQVLVYMIAGKERLTMSKVVCNSGDHGIALVIESLDTASLQLNAVGVIAALLAAFSFTYYNIAGHPSDEIRSLDCPVSFTLAASGRCSIHRTNTALRIFQQLFDFLFVFAVTPVLVPFVFFSWTAAPADQSIIASCLEPVFTI
jgi:drug/metabolite transporter (DMT)-like permease